MIFMLIMTFASLIYILSISNIININNVCNDSDIVYSLNNPYYGQINNELHKYNESIIKKLDISKIILVSFLQYDNKKNNNEIICGLYCKNIELCKSFIYSATTKKCYNNKCNSLVLSYSKKECNTNKCNSNNLECIKYEDCSSLLYPKSDKCNTNIIMLSLQSPCNIKKTLHHEIYHTIDSKLGYDIYDNEWTNINKFPYTDNYYDAELKEGFINHYSMYNHREDKATLYETLLYEYNRYIYNNIIVINKIKLLIKRLIEFDKNFIFVRNINLNN